MNCEVCFEKFKGIESLIIHETTESHRENFEKRQNALLDYSAEAVSVSDEAVPVSAESDSFVTEDIPVSTEAVPAATESVTIADESVRMSAEAAAVAAGTGPVAFYSKINNDNLFSCTTCSMGFSNISNAIQHSESMLHSTMVLATGIGFDEQIEICEDYNNSFPVLYYCIVCNFHCFKATHYDVHLKTRIHRRIVQQMSNFLKEKVEDATNICLNELTSKNGSKLPVQYYCKLCNTQFKNTKSYGRHLNGKKHRRILPLLKKIAYSKKENLSICLDINDTQKLNTSQYYCELCNISVNSNNSENHLKWKNHKRVEQYINTIINATHEDIDIFDISDNFKKFNNGRFRLYYCEICNIWCFGAKCYENHLNGKKHCKKTGRKRMNADPKSPDDNINDSSPFYHCEICSIKCATSKCFKQHLKSKIHIRIVQIMSEESIMKEGDASDSGFGAYGDTDESSQLPYYCKLCDVLCSGPKNYDCHLKGKTHETIKRITSTLSNVTG